MAGASFFFSGLSAIIASVVIIMPATDAAFCSAVRTTLVGIDDARFDEIFVFFRRRVETKRRPFAVLYLV